MLGYLESLLIEAFLFHDNLTVIALGLQKLAEFVEMLVQDKAQLRVVNVRLQFWTRSEDFKPFESLGLRDFLLDFLSAHLLTHDNIRISKGNLLNLHFLPLFECDASQLSSNSDKDPSIHGSIVELSLSEGTSLPV